ncbi:E3 SUMO-protein ligase pli1-like, partial [Trifolium medium]|nr:E3 SUMO-protein ligase pli1-like [Trifolium medium]
VVDTCETEDRKPFQVSFPTKADFRAGVDLPVLADPAFLNLKAEGHNQFLAPRHIHRTPAVIQALPHNSVTNFDSLITTSAASAYPHNTILSDAERQQLFSRLPLNIPWVSPVATQVLFIN